MLMPKSPESNAGNSAPEEGLGQATILDAAEAVFEAVDAILVVSLLIREGVLLLFEKALETIRSL